MCHKINRPFKCLELSMDFKSKKGVRWEMAIGMGLGSVIAPHAMWGKERTCMDKMWNLGISFLGNLAFGGKSLQF